MERWRGKVALVTGASSGIGYDLAKCLCQMGMNVVSCARNIVKIQSLTAELEATGGGCGKLVATKCDMRKEKDVKATFELAKAKFGRVDVCVSNAGLAHHAPLLSGATEEWREMLEVNVLGMSICNREFMSQLKERGVDEGHIFLINGMSGHRLLKPGASNILFYCATKYAVTALTEGIRIELRSMNSKVRVTSISPAMVRTEFVPRLTKADDMEANQKCLKNCLETEDMTSSIVYALAAPPRMEVHDILIRPTNQVL